MSASRPDPAEESASSALARVKRALGGLALLKRAQAVLTLGWIVGIGVAWFLRSPGPPRPVLLVVVLIPLLVTLLVALQSWRKNRTQPWYSEVKEGLGKRRLPSAEWEAAREALFRFQRYSSPVFVKGDLSKQFALGMLILSFVCSLLIVLFLR